MYCVLRSAEIYPYSHSVGKIKLDQYIAISIADGSNHILRPAGIIYYDDSHFTCRIVTEIGMLYYHDGLTTVYVHMKVTYLLLMQRIYGPLKGG